MVPNHQPASWHCLMPWIWGNSLWVEGCLRPASVFWGTALSEDFMGNMAGTWRLFVGGASQFFGLHRKSPVDPLCSQTYAWSSSPWEFHCWTPLHLRWRLHHREPGHGWDLDQKKLVIYESHIHEWRDERVRTMAVTYRVRDEITLRIQDNYRDRGLTITFRPILPLKHDTFKF